jgi:hypothetical protein
MQMGNLMNKWKRRTIINEDDEKYEDIIIVHPTPINPIRKRVNRVDISKWFESSSRRDFTAGKLFENFGLNFSLINEVEEKKEFDNTKIINFYKDEMMPEAKRKLSDIWKWNDSRLENAHDFIQWIFPTREKSRFNYSSHVLNCELIKIMKNDEEIMANLRTSFDVMFAFYGWRINDDGDNVERLEKPMKWIKFCHNYDRITRILNCLNIFDVKLSKMFFLAMCHTVLKYPKNKNLVKSYFEYWLPTQND